MHRILTITTVAFVLFSSPAWAGDKKASKKKTKASAVTVSCDFDNAWVSVLPADMYDEKEDFLMQSLIGLTEDPEFWGGEDEYKKLAAYAAQQCGGDGTEFQLAPGDYVVLVGWAGRYSEVGDYKDNGHIRKLTVKGKDEKIAVGKKDMTHTWVCISCPYLAVKQGGQLVGIGQTLVNRYSAKRAGTDVHAVQVDVVDEVIEIILIEREPETSYIDAVELVVDGAALKMLEPNAALQRRDGHMHSMKMGDQIVVRFDASGLGMISVDALVRVSGHYEPVGSLR